MVVNVRFEFPGDQVAQISRRFETFENRVRKPFRLGVGEKIDQYMRDVVWSGQFATEGGRGPQGRWKRLQPRYRQWKASIVGPSPVLVFTGAMRTALTKPGGRHMLRVEDRRMEMGIRRGTLAHDKARWHQAGAGSLPVRRVTDLRNDDKRAIVRIVQEGLIQQTRRLAGGPL